MSKAQREKGAAGERELCRIIRDVLGVDAHRNLSQTRDSGCDIIVPPFNIEVKRRKSIALYDWIDQAVKSTEGTHRKPVVICRGDGKGWLAVMRLQDWLPMAGNEMGGKNA